MKAGVATGEEDLEWLPPGADTEPRGSSAGGAATATLTRASKADVELVLFGFPLLLLEAGGEGVWLWEEEVEEEG